jgi:ABC-type transport system involved in cytochrome c biogenesis ATPase subunit
MLDVRNFGPFPKLNVRFSPTGINVISGPNESGKTQLVGSIIFALFGEKSMQYRPVTDTTCEVKLVIKEGKISQTLKYNIVKKSNQSNEIKPEINKSISYFPPTSDEIALHNNLIESFLETNKPKLLFNQIEDIKDLDIQSFNIVNESIKNDSEIYNLWINIQNSLIKINDKKDSFSKISILSEGQNIIIKCASEYVNRKKNNISIPLIINDDAFVSLDENGYKLACKLLSAIAQRDQVIILTSKPDKLLRILQNDVKNHIQLKKPELPYISSVGYRNNFLESQDDFKRKFILNQPIDLEENLYHEFKEIKGNNVTSSIKNVADLYVVAFLNSKIKKKGSIFWGIRDKDGIVVGVKLNSSGRDEIRRVVTEKFHKIQPAIPPTAYQIKMHKVYDLKKEVPNLYIIEIAVPPVSSDYLYSTGNGEVYIKTDAGKKKLTTLEIQKEILNRHKS